jgi:hypothetical protein
VGVNNHVKVSCSLLLLQLFIPYDFINKMNELGRMTFNSELKDRVERGDPTKLHEPPVEEDMPTGEPGTGYCFVNSEHAA